MESHAVTTSARQGRGRRRGGTNSRDEILGAARLEFEERGYEGATVRAIAARAGVDAAMIHHYFGTKENLFLAAMEIPLEPSALIEEITAGSEDELGKRAVLAFLGVWNEPAIRQPLLAMLRSAMTNEVAATMLRQFVTRVLLQRLAAAFDGLPDAELRAEIAASHLVGMGILRFVVKVEPLASATDDELAELIGPVVQQYLSPHGAG